MPSSPARATKASKSSIVPRSGCTASWPPSAEPMAHGLPGSSAPAASVLSRPLRWVVPIGWIGRQVDDVEAEVGDVGEVLGRPLQPAERAREQLVPGGMGGGRPIDPERLRRRWPTAGRRGGRRRRRPPRGRSRPRAGRPASSSVRRVPAAAVAQAVGVGGVDPRRQVLEQPRPLLQLQVHVLARRRPSPRSRGARWRSGRSSLDHQLVRPDLGRAIGAGPPVVRRRWRRGRCASRPSPARRQRTRAAMTSCPSAMSVAETATTSPTTALAGNPAGVRGWTSSITIGGSTRPPYEPARSGQPGDPRPGSEVERDGSS